jgi:hypothetical protein
VRQGIAFGGIGAGVAGGILTGLAALERRGVSDLATGIERQRANSSIGDLNNAAVACYAVAGAAFVTYLTWTFWPTSDIEMAVMPGNQTSARLSVSF